MIAGTANLDAAMTYEPYLGAVRDKPEAGKIIATTLDYPMMMDTFGCTPKFLADNPKAAQGAGRRLLRRAGDDQGRPEEELRDHGRRREAAGRASSRPARSTCAGRTARRTRSSSPANTPQFSKEAADLLLEAGIIKQMPDMTQAGGYAVHQVTVATERACGPPSVPRGVHGGRAGQPLTAVAVVRGRVQRARRCRSIDETTAPRSPPPAASRSA